MPLLPRSCLRCKGLRKLSSESGVLCSGFLCFGVIVMRDERQPLRTEVLGNLKSFFIVGLVEQKNELYVGNGQICQFSVKGMNAGMVVDENRGTPGLDFALNCALDSISSCEEQVPT